MRCSASASASSIGFVPAIAGAISSPMMSSMANWRCTPAGSGVPVAVSFAMFCAVRQRQERVAVDDGLEGRQVAGARPVEIVVGEELHQPERRLALLGRCAP